MTGLKQAWDPRKPEYVLAGACHSILICLRSCVVGRLGMLDLQLLPSEAPTQPYTVAAPSSPADEFFNDFFRQRDQAAVLERLATKRLPTIAEAMQAVQNAAEQNEFFIDPQFNNLSFFWPFLPVFTCGAQCCLPSARANVRGNRCYWLFC